MQQTRVEQGTAYYLAFINKFPKPAMLAKAPLDDVLKLWQGLGYYSRARNLHEAAKTIVAEHKGVFPSEYADILRLKGVGEYTAAAIASFAFRKPYAVVDGNVYRLLSRVFGIATPIDSSKGKAEFRELAALLLDTTDPGTYNQAAMEFGARYCKPRNPDCPNCIFFAICIARKNNLVHELPVKANKTKVRDRFFHYLVIGHKANTWLRQRAEKDIWEGLYEFPLIESEKILTEAQLQKSAEWKRIFKNQKPAIGRKSQTYKHLLSHQRIFAVFWEIKVLQPITEKKWKKTPVSKLQDFAIPRLVDLYLTERG
jgi:A/G-specific adenine glycosylase